MKSRCSCGAIYTIKPEFLGKKTLCKNCGRNFLIEALPAPQLSPEPSPSEPLEFSSLESEPPAASGPEPAPPEPVHDPPAASGPEPAPSEPVADSPATADPEPALLESAPLASFSPPPPEADIPPRPSEVVLDEIAPLEEIGPASPPDPDGRAEPPVLADEAGLRGGRRPLVALAVAAVAGTLVGAGLMGLIRQSEIDVLEAKLTAAGRELQSHSQARRKLGDLRKELALVQDEIGLLEGADHPAGSIPLALAAAAALEYRTAEALLRQQIAALESGARLTVSARATAPDPELAAAVEGEMARLKARLEELRGVAEGPLIQTAIATEELNLAILNRNRLIARYGLNSPLPPPQGPAF